MINELPGIALTAVRYGLAENMSNKIEAGEPITADMAVLIAADIADGVVLRQFDLDTPLRRVADGVVDHLSVARVALEVSKANPETKPYLAILAVRAAFVGILNGAHLLSTGEVTKGGHNQKATNISEAAFCLAALSGSRKATHITGAIATGIALYTSAANLKGLGRKHSNGIRQL